MSHLRHSAGDAGIDAAGDEDGWGVREQPWASDTAANTESARFRRVTWSPCVQWERYRAGTVSTDFKEAAAGVRVVTNPSVKGQSLN